MKKLLVFTVLVVSVSVSVSVSGPVSLSSIAISFNMTDWTDGELVPVNVMLDSIFPYFITYRLLPKGSTPSDVNNEHLVTLGARWKVNGVKNKSGSLAGLSLSDPFDMPLLQALYTQCEVLDSRRGGRKMAGGNSSMLTAERAHTLQPSDTYDSFLPPPKPKFKELDRNYFGLPIYALNRTAEGIVYQARKPYEGISGQFSSLGAREEEYEEEEEQSLEEKIEVKATNHRYVPTVLYCVM